MARPQRGADHIARNRLKYTRARALGRGSFGDVYRGTLDEANQVAVKVLRAGNPVAARQFRRELRRYKQLQGAAGVVPYYGTSRTSATRTASNFAPTTAPTTTTTTDIAVTELMAGGSLRTAFDKGRLPPDTTLLVAEIVANALASVHARGFSHGDLKPNNVLLSRSLDEECAEDRDLGVPPVRAKLVDFGLSRDCRTRVSPDDSEDELPRAYTLPLSTPQHMEPLGTPQYLAPEAWRGRTALRDSEIALKADIYALGMLLYELTSGLVPWAGVRESEWAIFGAVFHGGERPKWPEEEERVTGMRAIVERCWAQDYRLRPSARTVARELRELRRANGMDTPPEQSALSSPERRTMSGFRTNQADNAVAFSAAIQAMRLLNTGESSSSDEERASGYENGTEEDVNSKERWNAEEESSGKPKEITPSESVVAPLNSTEDVPKAMEQNESMIAPVNTEVVPKEMGPSKTAVAPVNSKDLAKEMGPNETAVAPVNSGDGKAVEGVKDSDVSSMQRPVMSQLYLEDGKVGGEVIRKNVEALLSEAGEIGEVGDVANGADALLAKGDVIGSTELVQQGSPQGAIQPPPAPVQCNLHCTAPPQESTMDVAQAQSQLQVQHPPPALDESAIEPERFLDVSYSPTPPPGSANSIGTSTLSGITTRSGDGADKLNATVAPLPQGENASIAPEMTGDLVTASVSEHPVYPSISQSVTPYPDHASISPSLAPLHETDSARPNAIVEDVNVENLQASIQDMSLTETYRPTLASMGPPPDPLLDQDTNSMNLPMSPNDGVSLSSGTGSSHSSVPSAAFLKVRQRTAGNTRFVGRPLDSQEFTDPNASLDPIQQTPISPLRVPTVAPNANVLPAMPKLPVPVAREHIPHPQHHPPQPQVSEIQPQQQVQQFEHHSPIHLEQGHELLASSSTEAPSYNHPQHHVPHHVQQKQQKQPPPLHPHETNYPFKAEVHANDVNAVIFALDCSARGIDAVHALHALAVLCGVDDGNRVVAVRGGVLEVAAMTVARHGRSHAGCARAMCELVLQLARARNSEVERELRNTAATEHVINALRWHAASREVAQAGTQALAALCRASTALATIVAAQGGPHTAVRALSRAVRPNAGGDIDPAFAMSAIDAVAALAVAHATELLAAGALAEVVSATRCCAHPAVDAAAVGVIRAVAQTPDGRRALCNEPATIAALANVMARARYGPEPARVLGHACEAIAALAEEGKAAGVALTAGPVLEAVLWSLAVVDSATPFHAGTILAVRALTCLKRMAALSEDTCAELHSAHALDAACAVVNARPESGDVAVCAAEFVATVINGGPRRSEHIAGLPIALEMLRNLEETWLMDTNVVQVVRRAIFFAEKATPPSAASGRVRPSASEATVKFTTVKPRKKAFALLRRKKR